MFTYVIGDVQGCYEELIELLKLINTHSTANQLIFVGDLINRGPQSLATLRYIRSLGKQANVVLGNHDLHLLAVSQGIQQMYPSDTLYDILLAPDCNELIAWLRRCSLAIFKKNYLIFHAGVLPAWDTNQVMRLAREVEIILRSPNWIEFLNYVYKNTSTVKWSNNLKGHKRLKCILQILTQIRFCTANGYLDFQNKGTHSQYSNYFPWFAIPSRKTAKITCIFGHWSTLGLILQPNVIGLDTGCVWGGKLSAIRLEDKKLFQITAKNKISIY